MKYIEKVRNDFDRIAMLDDDSFDNNKVFHNMLLRFLPPDCSHILDIGCGKGEFTRLLSSRAHHVTGIDLSKNMISVAKDYSENINNVDFIECDIMDFPLPDEYYDAIVSITAFHHMQIDEVIPRIIPSLKKGGKIIILDLFKPESLFDYLKSFVSLFYSGALRFRKTRSLRSNSEAINLWNEHASTDVYLSTKEINKQYGRYLKDYNFKTHLLWRYSLVWVK